MKAGEIFVAGKWQATRSGETYQPINPANEEPIGAVGKGDEGDIDLAVTAARKAFDEGPWPKMNPHERGRIVWRLGDLIQQNLDEMARLESLCTGKTMFDSGKVEIPFAAEVFRYYAGWATKIHGETLGLRDNAFTFTLRQPVGVVGAIVPWNFPFLLSSWKIAPALAAGNTMVIKPASQTPLTALRFAEICQEAGVPEGVFNVVTGPGGKVGMALVRDPRRRQDRLHRLHRRRQADHAGGGGDAQAPLARARRQVAQHRVRRRGHGRGGARRAHRHLLQQGRGVRGRLAALPGRLDPRPVHGQADRPGQEPEGRRSAWTRPPAWARWSSKGQMETVLSYIESGKQEGARVVAGGGRADVGTGKGYFIQPTIFDGVTNEMKIAREEIFGPVLSVIPFRSVEDGDRPGQPHARTAWPPRCGRATSPRR